jgi:hypothetical protein
MVMPMSSALFLHEMFRHSEMVVASTPTSAFNLIVTDQTGDGVGFTAAGLVIKLMRAHFAGALPVQLDGNPSQPMVSGTAWVDVDIGTKPTGSPPRIHWTLSQLSRQTGRSSFFRWSIPRYKHKSSRLRSAG